MLTQITIALLLPMMLVSYTFDIVAQIESRQKDLDQKIFSELQYRRCMFLHAFSKNLQDSLEYALEQNLDLTPDSSQLAESFAQSLLDCVPSESPPLYLHHQKNPNYPATYPNWNLSYQES